MAKPKKERAKKYDTKLAINGTFEDVIKLSVTSMPKKVDKPKNPLQLRKKTLSALLVRNRLPYVYGNEIRSIIRK